MIPTDSTLLTNMKPITRSTVASPKKILPPLRSIKLIDLRSRPGSRICSQGINAVQTSAIEAKKTGIKRFTEAEDSRLSVCTVGAESDSFISAYSPYSLTSIHCFRNLNRKWEHSQLRFRNRHSTFCRVFELQSQKATAPARQLVRATNHELDHFLSLRLRNQLLQLQ